MDRVVACGATDGSSTLPGDTKIPPSLFIKIQVSYSKKLVMKNRLNIKEQELRFLAQEYKTSPELFKQYSFVEDSTSLEKFGIFIEDKQRLPHGFVKLWPQDFIVQEISKEGGFHTVYLENLLKKDTPLEGSPTTYATLVKCGLSTIEAINELSESLDCEKSQIQTAGIKDKDAITTQRISFRKISGERLKTVISPYFFLKKVTTGKGVVEKGGLMGNRFTVLVRMGKDFNPELFLDNLKKIKNEGFNNFYYLQRFGTPRLINFYWGLFILRGEYRRTVLSFLTSGTERELSYFRKLREGIKDSFGNWKKIKIMMSTFPLIFQNELKVISYLEKNPRDFGGALFQIPEQITLWLYALSSWLFNKKLSSYIKNKKEPPQKLPLFLSQDKRDWLFYKDFLEKLKIFPPPLHNLRLFSSYIQFKKREINTKEQVKINQVEIIKEGVVLDFFLPKGVYATTFLAHLFCLVSGKPPEEISDKAIDIKAILGKKPLTKTLEYFREVIHPKTENIFEKFK